MKDEAHFTVQARITDDQRREIIRAFVQGDRIHIDIQDPKFDERQSLLGKAIGHSLAHMATRIRVRFEQDPWAVIKDKERA